ncbi:MAG: TetR/AcrR family transcriptional regulator [Limosilactobacillus sp.]|uniref:TetR/AcrR family transcriptional regulator n=1 Tax=Limosilactobacillus sp. TaxID=2773925 RepID=UPI0026FF6B58|nr:TetR/AcrR family transcriptional regulator [Limosilactobacillus sp.]
MPSLTFENLSDEKKNLITQALLHEFSEHNLANAQVARIVKEAGIARGAFYKYFEDIKDAYTYVYRDSLLKLHSKDIRNHTILSADQYTKQVADFIEQVHDSQYRELLKRHYTINESLIEVDAPSKLLPLDKKEWAVMTLTHQAIREGLVHSEESDMILNRLHSVLVDILKEG